MLNKGHIKLDDFSGGLVTVGSPLALAANQSPDCLNVVSNIGKSAKKRNGYAKLNSVSTAATCNGIYNFRHTDTAQYLVGLWGTGFKKMDVVTSAWDGTWDAVSVDANKGTALSSATMYNTVSNNDCVITTESRDVPQKYNPTDNAALTDLDWETSHAKVTGDISTYTATSNDKIKIVLDTGTFDNIVLTDDVSIANVVSSINAASGFSAKGLAYADDDGYLVIISNTRGSASTVNVAHGSTDANGTCVAALFDATKTIGDATITGAGIDDMTSGGTYTGTADLSYRVQIDGTGATDTFKWSDDGGSTWDVETVSITGAAQTLNNGVTITFAAITGHTDTNYWDFTVTVDLDSETITGGAPSGKHCTAWHSFTWIGNTSDNPDRLYRSAAGDNTTWSATAYETISTPGDIGITGFAALRGRLIVFKKNSIHLITYLGGEPLLSVTEIKTKTGTSSPRSILNVDIPSVGEVILFFGTDLQWYMFDGRLATPLTEGISTYNSISKYCTIGNGSTYGLNPAALSAVHAVHYPKKHWAILFFPLDNDTTAKDAFVYDYYTKSIYPFHFNDIFTASCIADNGAGQRLCYTAGTNFSYLFDTTNADVAASINGYWTSPKIDGGSEVELNDYKRIVLTTSSSAAVPTVQFKTDWESSWSTAVSLTANTEVHVEDVPRLGDLFQFKITDNSTAVSFELIRATLVASKKGVAK